MTLSVNFLNVDEGLECKSIYTSDTCALLTHNPNFMAAVGSLVRSSSVMIVKVQNLGDQIAAVITVHSHLPDLTDIEAKILLRHES